jgi:hypothetical protein
VGRPGQNILHQGVAEKMLLGTGRKKVASITGVGESHFLRWTHLAAKMAEVNHFKRVCASVPTQKTVQEWIDHARHLNPMISY